MKKWLSLLLVLALAMPAAGALAQETATMQPSVVALATRMSGNLYSDLWGANTVDASIRSLLTGYATVAWSFTGAYGVDGSVVTDFMTEDDARGNRTYTLTLAENLTYNDGTPITAADYAFTALLQSDPAIPALGGQNTSFSYVQGYAKYAAGKIGVLTGLRLLSPYRLSITVPANALPYFYELTYALLTPTPIGVLAPGYAVYDNGNGAFLGKTGESNPAAPGASPLTVDLLSQTLTAPDGYLHQPRVTSGPYQLLAYDPETASATLSINPRYAGNAEGRKPELATVQIVQMDSVSALSALQAGQVQMIHNITNPDVVDAARQQNADGKLNLGNHLNSGYAFLALACELAPTDDVQVRRAIAQCVDRAAFCTGLYRSNALPVYGYYGYAQWMVQQTTEDLTLLDPGFDVETARATLEAAGYTYNEDGAAYQPGKKQIRCKLKNGVLTPLALRWAKTESPSADLLEQQLTTAFDALGIGLTVDEMSFSDMLRQYYRVDGQRDYQLFFLSEMFPYVFDPTAAYQTGDAWQGAFNTSGLRDEKLLKTAQNLRNVPSGDNEGYLAKWSVFQQRWVDLMPTVPIYCTVVYDATVPTVYAFTDYARYGLDAAILYATYTAPAPTATMEPAPSAEPMLTETPAP